MRRSAEGRGAALVEFALAWPVTLLLVLGCVQLALWASETLAARSAAPAGARAATAAGASTTAGTLVAVRVLAAAVPGVSVAAWCPGDSRPRPDVFVCATDHGTSIEVRIDGTAPSLVPIAAASGLHLHADVSLDKEVFR